LGRRLAYWCQVRGWTQQQLGGHTAYSRSSIAHIQRGEQTPGADFWATCDRLLDAGGQLTAAYQEYDQARRAWHEQDTTALVPPAATTAPAPWTSAPGRPGNGHEPTSAGTVGGEVEDVNRKEFLAGLVTAPGLLLTGLSRPTRVGTADLARYRQSLVHLYALDDHYGASSEVYGLTIHSLRHLLSTLEHASYTPAVGDQLRSITGEVMEHAGWLAFDAGHAHHARYWWLEALHTARMANDDGVEVVVLASMSLAATRYGRGREAADLASTAARVAAARPTPRLVSLLAAREALGHALNGDIAATRRALDRAHTQLDHGRRDEDPSWLDFWGPSDLAGHTTRAARYLGDLLAAERGARGALATVDLTSHPRNYAIYQAHLAGILAEQRNVEEALPVLADAALHAASLNSERLTSEIRTVVHELNTHHGNNPAVRDLAAWTATNLSTPGPWPTTPN
jgi:hypothetical protein